MIKVGEFYGSRLLAECLKSLYHTSVNLGQTSEMEDIEEVAHIVTQLNLKPLCRLDSDASWS